MAVVEVFTKERMLAIENSTVVDGAVNEDGDLILLTRDGTPINAGDVRAPNLADASTTVKGIVELATEAEGVTGTSEVLALTPKSGKAAIDTAITAIPDASVTVKGKVELATVAEAVASTDPSRAVTPSGLSFLSERGLDNLIHNGSFRINQIGYASGGSLIPGMATGFGHDRWRSSGRANLCRNPTGGTNTTGWSGSNSTISRLTGLTIPGLSGVTTAIRGTNNLAAVGGLYFNGDAAAAAYPIPVLPGVTYRITAWLRANVAKTIQPSIQFSNPAQTLVASDSTPTAAVALSANVWTKVSYLYRVPILVSTVNPPGQMGPYWYSTTAWAVGNTLDIAGVTITETSTSADPAYSDGSFLNCSWVGTAHASISIDRTVVTSYTFTQTPNGCVITLNSGGAIYQVIERPDIPAGDYVFGHDGTATMRIYNRTAAPPLFAAGPIVVTLDGLDDVIVEFEANGGTKTVSNVRGFRGGILFPFRPRPYQIELSLCQRHRFRLAAPSPSGGGPLLSGYGVQQSTTVAVAPANNPVPMRARALLAWNLLYWTDRVGFNSAVNALTYASSTEPVSTAKDIAFIEVFPFFTAAGVANRSGAIVGQAGTSYVDLNSEVHQV